MHFALSVLVAALGGTAVGWGLRTWWRTRLTRATPYAARRRTRRRLALASSAVGSVLLLAPDAIAALVLAGDAAAQGATAVLLLLYRLAVLAALVPVGALLLLGSDPVLSRGQRGAARLAALAPTRASRQVRALRRAHPAFPASLAELVEHDRALARQLLAHHGGAGIPREEHALLGDLADPHTKAAVEAMFRCDATRPATPSATRARTAPTPTTDVLHTAYGQAVLEFETALRRAQEHAAASAPSERPADLRVTAVGTVAG